MIPMRSGAIVRSLPPSLGSGLNFLSVYFSWAILFPMWVTWSAVLLSRWRGHLPAFWSVSAESSFETRVRFACRSSSRAPRLVFIWNQRAMVTDCEMPSVFRYQIIFRIIRKIRRLSFIKSFKKWHIFKTFSRLGRDKTFFSSVMLFSKIR